MNVHIPDDLWEDDVEGILVTWLYDDGAPVRENVTLAQIMVEKTQFDLTAPADGRLTIVKQADETIRKGDLVATLAEL